MTNRIQRNQQFLADLFAGPFRGHGIIANPEPVESPLGDFLLSDRPVRDWLPWVTAPLPSARAPAQPVQRR